MEGNQKLDRQEPSAPAADGLEHGPQPLEAVMAQHNLTNTQLVHVLPELQLTHKMIGKGRRGRRLSRKIQRKIAQALNAATSADGRTASPRIYQVEELFTYDGR